MANQSKLSTYFLLVIVMLIWGVNVIALKVLVDYFPPIMLTSFRVFFAGLVVLLVVLFKNELKWLSKKEWGFLLLATSFGVLGHHIFLAYGLIHTTASNASIILALLPLTTALLARILIAETLTRSRFFGIILGFVGVMFVVLQNDAQIGQQTLGDVFIFLSMLFQALSFITIKNLTNTLNSRQLTAMMFIIGSLTMFFISLFVETEPLFKMKSGSIIAWVILLSSAIVATGLGHMIYNGSIHRLGASETAVFINLSPLFGLISSALFLGEEVGWKQIIGFILIVIGVIFGAGAFERKIASWKVKKVS